MSATLDLAIELISRPSVTPDDAGCQVLMAERLAASGFRSERLDCGGVHNLWARRGSEGPLFVFAGHSDVVPVGARDQWYSDPFRPEVRDGLLHGRGAADMKGSLAAMVTACEDFVRAHPEHRGSIALLVTSDEEGPAVHGTRHVIETLQARGEHIDYCLVGEPSCEQRLGDTVKVGRRGSLHGTLIVHGKQGHIAYPQRARNPLHALAPTLARLCAEEWDQGNDYFPPTGFQIYQLEHGAGAENIIPGRLVMRFNFRYSTALDQTRIDQRVRAILDQGGFAYDLDWRLGAEPFLTSSGELLEATTAAIHAHTGLTPKPSTSGGTSDGRFIAPTGAQVLEFGPLNATIHQVNECVAVTDLDKLSTIYRAILERLLS